VSVASSADSGVAGDGASAGGAAPSLLRKSGGSLGGSLARQPSAYQDADEEGTAMSEEAPSPSPRQQAGGPPQQQHSPAPGPSPRPRQPQASPSRDHAHRHQHHHHHHTAAAGAAAAAAAAGEEEGEAAPGPAPPRTSAEREPLIAAGRGATKARSLAARIDALEELYAQQMQRLKGYMPEGAPEAAAGARAAAPDGSLMSRVDILEDGLELLLRAQDLAWQEEERVSRPPPACCGNCTIS
jgi:hypothetical protein